MIILKLLIPFISGGNVLHFYICSELTSVHAVRACLFFFCFVCFSFPLSGLGFAGQWHASPRLAPYSPGAAGIPDEWYGRRRRRPQTRRGAFPFKHDLMTTDFFSEGRPEDRTRGWQPGTPEDRFSEKKPVTATDSPGQYRTQRPCRGSWFGASLREQLALDGYYLTCPQVGLVPIITSIELKEKSIILWLFKSSYHLIWGVKNDHNST